MCNIKISSKFLKPLLAIILVISFALTSTLLLGYEEETKTSNSHLADEETKTSNSHLADEAIEFATKYQDEIEELSIWFYQNKEVLENIVNKYGHGNPSIYQRTAVKTEIREAFPENIGILYDEMLQSETLLIHQALDAIYAEDNFTVTGEWKRRDPIIYNILGKADVAYFYDIEQIYEKYKDYPTTQSNIYEGIDYYNYIALDESLGYGTSPGNFTKINDNLYVFWIRFFLYR